MKRLHLGVDYGTNASKLVLRYFEAPGGERAYLLEPNGKLRIPSAVSFDQKNIYLNRKQVGGVIFKSLKMRFAEEVTGEIGSHFYGDLTPIPNNFTAEDLVILSIWRLISIGHLEGVRILGNDDFKMGMTMGIPMSFLDREDLKSAFLSAARHAYLMYRDFGPNGSDQLEIKLAHELLAIVRQSLKGKPPIDENNFRNWIRSETEASMLWSFFSPSIPSGPYFCVDIGAGTTDANAFLINEDHQGDAWVKNSMCFFGAHSIPYAMDAISLLTQKNKDQGYAAIREGLIQTGRNAYAHIKDNYYSVKQWSDPKLILLGGGALEQDLCRALQLHPMVNWKGVTMEAVKLTVPDDLVRSDESSVSREDVIFTSVAYGLAQIGAAVPEAAKPNEVQPVIRHTRSILPDHQMMYDD